MKTELTDVSPTRKEIKIEIEPSLIRSTYDRISDEYSKQAKVPGFRPGHAPRSVIRTRYKNEIRTEVLRELLPEAVNNAIDEHSLAAIGEPNVELDNSEALDNFGEAPITVKVGVEVLPEIKLENYKGLEAKRLVRPVTDADVDKAIDNLRHASAALQPVEDRGAELGDTVTLNARGKFADTPSESEASAEADTEPKTDTAATDETASKAEQPDDDEHEEIHVEDVEVVLGGPGVQQEFTDNLLGTRPEDKKSFVVDYPADFSSQPLAGHKVEYEVEVTAVRRKELPEVDDEWVKSLGFGVDDVATLKSRIREDLDMRLKSDAERHVRDELIRQLIAAHPFEVPQSFVEQQTNQRLQAVVREMMGRGVDPRNPDMNWEGAREELKEQAENDVRATMLLEHIAQAENITVSDEEVEAEIEAIATASQQSKEQVRAALTKNGGERSIAHRLRTRKALELLLENANITEAEWTETTNDTDEEASSAQTSG
ncbi:MAG: trigger factor [Acidobacteria bacterium]|nr:trigger factor [Acidobacteriota bacterium]